MLAGELYDPLDPELIQARRRARLLLKQLNDTRDDEEDVRIAICQELFGAMDEGFWLQPPFWCDYGSNIHFGANVFLNFNCVILDVATVTIGNRVLLGPAVQVYTATHPLSAMARRRGLELSKPIVIGDDVWIGGGAIINPGVRIGAGAVIGAGSVVTRDIPEGMFVAGNPCRIIRPAQ